MRSTTLGGISTHVAALSSVRDLASAATPIRGRVARLMALAMVAPEVLLAWLRGGLAPRRIRRARRRWRQAGRTGGARSGGLLTLAAVLSVANGAPAFAQANLTVDTANGNSPFTAATSQSYSTVVIGNANAGQFKQTSSSVTTTVTSTTTLGVQAGSNGTLNLSGGAYNQAGSSLFVGAAGTGTLGVASGGTISDSIGYLGYSSGSTGTASVTGAGST